MPITRTLTIDPTAEEIGEALADLPEINMIAAFNAMATRIKNTYRNGVLGFEHTLVGNNSLLRPETVEVFRMCGELVESK